MNESNGYLFLCIACAVPFFAGIGVTLVIQRFSGVIRRAWEDLFK